jgi:hypothetical protein
LFTFCGIAGERKTGEERRRTPAGAVMCDLNDTQRPAAQNRLEPLNRPRRPTHTNIGEVIMRLCFDCDLGSLAVLVIGIGSVAFLAMSI